VAVPQAWIECDVEDIAAAAAELRANGYKRRTLEVVSSSDAFILLGVMFIIAAAILWWTQLRKP
jgi:hypothetical protein